jgi:glycosyltransferase involved in cell wall biosynthesis
MERKRRLLRITTVPISLKLLLRGQLQYFQNAGYEVLAVSGEGKEIEAIRKEGIPHQRIPMTRKITPLQDLISLLKIMRVIKRFKPDIVHTHTPKAGLLGMIAAFFCRVPVRLHTVAGLPVMEATGLRRKLLVLTEKITYVCATRVYPNSFALKEYIEKHLRTSATVSVIGKGSSNGINTAEFKRSPELEKEAREIRTRYGVAENDFVFSFVGRIVVDKGIHELIHAFRQLLRDESRKAFLILVGDFEKDLDPLSDEDQKFIESQDRIILPGFQSDVRPWVMASDCFVFPSYREGFPNVVMQAACLEVPAIVSDINGCNEIIEHDVTGIVVKVKDSQHLFEAMKRMMANPPVGKTFAKKAHDFVVANFDQHYVWSELRAQYEEQLNALKKNRT